MTENSFDKSKKMLRIERTIMMLAILGSGSILLVAAIVLAIFSMLGIFSVRERVIEVLGITGSMLLLIVSLFFLKKIFNS